MTRDAYIYENKFMIPEIFKGIMTKKDAKARVRKLNESYKSMVGNKFNQETLDRVNKALYNYINQHIII